MISFAPDIKSTYVHRLYSFTQWRSSLDKTSCPIGWLEHKFTQRVTYKVTKIFESSQNTLLGGRQRRREGDSMVYLPSTPWTWCFLIIAFVESVIVLGFEGYEKLLGYSAEPVLILFADLSSRLSKATSLKINPQEHPHKHPHKLEQFRRM